MNAREAYELTTVLRKDVALANDTCRVGVLANPKFAVECYKRLVNKEPLADMTEEMQAAVACCAIAKILELLVELPREKAGEILASSN